MTAILLEPEVILATLQKNFEFCYAHMKNDTKKKNKGEARWNLAMKAAEELTIEMIQAAEDLLEKADSLEREILDQQNQQEMEERLKGIGASLADDKDFQTTMDEWELDKGAEAELMNMGYSKEEIQEMMEEHHRYQSRFLASSQETSG